MAKNLFLWLVCDEDSRWYGNLSALKCHFSQGVSVALQLPNHRCAHAFPMTF